VIAVRRKFMTMLLALGVLTMALSNAIAEDVFVTKKGKKYHKADSRFIKGKEVTKMSREDAEAKGYKPSSDFLNEETPKAETK
jgi:hypothetical protein